MPSFMEAMRLQKYGLIYAVILLATLIIAATFPMMNDETYYIAFAKNLQLSYVDHPPFVSYLSFAQTSLGLHAPLYERALVIVLHLLSTVFLMAIVYNHCTNDKHLPTKLLLTFLICYLIPIFGFFSIFILPDTGLILSLSILLWTADKVLRSNHLSVRNTIELGIGLGIGLLAKYHILPLGGGILCGICIDLAFRAKFRWSDALKILTSVLIGIMIAWPVLVWNINNHFASFLFQAQHGLHSKQWHFGGSFVFIFLSVLYLTPWFGFHFLKRGFGITKPFYLIIPIAGLFCILLFSSFSNHVLPHWISPAFWLLIPYSVIYCEPHHLGSLMKQCQYTALIWLPLLIALSLPGNMWNLRSFIEWVHGNTPNSWCSLFWEDFEALVQQDRVLSELVNTTTHQTPNPGCAENRPIVAASKRIWASQFEYHAIFPGAKIINLEQNSSNFYLWRDNWADYANCNILFIGEGDENLVGTLVNLLDVKNQYSLQGVNNYPKLHLQVISGTLKGKDTIQALQKNLLTHPHY